MEIEMVDDVSDDEEKKTPSICRSNREWNKANIEINDKLITEEEKEAKITKILLVSTRKSGKSTIFKQIKCIYGWGVIDDEDEIQTHINDIRENCIMNAIYLSVMVGDERTAQRLQCLQSDDDEMKWNEIEKLISNLWSKQSIQQKYELRHINKNFADIIDENMDYFWNKIDDIMSMDYMPSQQDMIKCKMRNDSIQQCEYDINDTLISMINIPTTFCEKMEKKFYMLDNANCLIFVIDLSSYCIWRNDKNMNAMKYTMKCFENVVNCKWTKKLDIILVMNKYDIFEQQIKNGISLSQCFDEKQYGWHTNNDYGNIKILICVSYIARNICLDNNMQEIPLDIIQLIEYYIPITPIHEEKEVFEECCRTALQFICQTLSRLNHNPYKRVFTFKTTAIDQDSMESVFWGIQDVVIRSNMKTGGS